MLHNTTPQHHTTMKGGYAMQRTQEQVKEMIAREVIAAIGRAATVWKAVEDMPMPRLRYDIRGLSCNGMCCYPEWTLRFNPIVMMAEPEAFCAATVVHEVAHLVAYWVFGNVQPHGKEWKHVMRKLGAVPARCSTYNLAGIVKPGYHEYVCGCCSHYVTTRKHKKIQSGAEYICCRCREILRPAAGERKVA